MNIPLTKFTGSIGEAPLLDSIRQEGAIVDVKLLPRATEPFSVNPALHINWLVELSGSSAIEITTSRLRNTIIGEIGGVPSVENIFIDEEDGVIIVWTIINEEDDEVLRNIFQREGNIIGMLPDLLFDFHIKTRRGRLLESIISFDGKPIYSRT